jgi:hypothetical protein
MEVEMTISRFSLKSTMLLTGVGLLVLVLITTVVFGNSHNLAFITTTDYTTGSSSTISLDGSYTVVKNVAGIHSDAESRYYDGLFYVVNREGGDNIQILDPDNGFATVRQFSVGASSNPIDIVVVSSTKAYVSRNDETDLWIVNPSTGAHTGSISLASLADGDGIPEMDHMCRIGDRLFISIQRLDRDYYWLPAGTSYIAVVDIAADTLVDTDLATPGRQSITLTGTDPYNDIQLNPYTGELYVSCVGTWGLQDGGVEVIDPITCQSGGFILTETTAGGDINDVEIVQPDKGYIIISDASFNNVLKSFNPVTGTILNTLYAPGAYVLPDIELAPTGELFLSDRTATNPGIRLFNILTDAQLTSNPIDLDLPPFDICFSFNIPTGAVAAAVPRPASLGQNFPNPFNPSTIIPFNLDQDMQAKLKIYDVSGRLVRNLMNEVRSAGPNQIRWDGRDDLARGLPSGIYFARLEAGDYKATRKLLLLK